MTVTLGDLKGWVAAAVRDGISDDDVVECGVTSSHWKGLLLGKMELSFDVHTPIGGDSEFSMELRVKAVDG